jgi:hypothetical protein
LKRACGPQVECGGGSTKSVSGSLTCTMNSSTTGVGSTLRAASTARTSSLCGPSGSCAMVRESPTSTNLASSELHCDPVTQSELSAARASRRGPLRRRGGCGWLGYLRETQRKFGGYGLLHVGQGRAGGTAPPPHRSHTEPMRCLQLQLPNLQVDSRTQYPTEAYRPHFFIYQISGVDFKCPYSNRP